MIGEELVGWPASARWRTRGGLPPTRWFYSSRFGFDLELDERVGSCAAAWAAPARPGHPWVALPGAVGSSDITVWWQLGRPLASGRPRRPRIEVQGEDDPGAVVAESGWVLDHVAWWIVAGIDPEAAEQWVRVGVRFGPVAAGWARALGVDLQSHFDGRPLARRRRGCWRPTQRGWEVVGRLGKLGVGPQELQHGIPRRLARISGRDLDTAIRTLEKWDAVIPASRYSHGGWLVWWAVGDVSMAEAPAWLDAGLVDPYEVRQWRQEGFEPAAAAGWRRDVPGIQPWTARTDHLAAFGETNGLGPQRSWRSPTPVDAAGSVARRANKAGFAGIAGSGGDRRYGRGSGKAL
jgi:hypothetical protein